MHDSPNECVEVRVRSRRTLAPTETQMSKKWCATCLTGQPRFLAAVVTHRSMTVSNHFTKMSSPTWLSSRHSNSLNTENINISIAEEKRYLFVKFYLKELKPTYHNIGVEIRRYNLSDCVIWCVLDLRLSKCWDCSFKTCLQHGYLCAVVTHTSNLTTTIHLIRGNPHGVRITSKLLLIRVRVVR